MTGRLQEKCGKYYIILNTYIDGKRVPKWISTKLPVKGNKKRAERMLQDKIREYEAKEGIVPSNVSFADYVRLWLKHKEKTVDVVTYQGYKILAETHILPYFDASGVELSKLTKENIQDYINNKAINGRRDGKGGLSSVSLKLHKNIINQTCLMALMNKMIASNPCEFVRLPQAKKFEYSYYSASQINALLEVIKDDPLYPLIKVTAIYGLRRSEVLGIKHDSINYDLETLTIKHTVSKVSTVVEKDKTKNASSRRSFPLLSEIKQLFIELEEKQKLYKKEFGSDYYQSDYVFTWPDGRPFSPDYVSQHFSDLLKKHNLPHIRFHELRHSCASILLSQGFTLKDVQEWLGHTDIKMTANVYGHLDVERKKNIGESLRSQIIVR